MTDLESKAAEVSIAYALSHGLVVTDTLSVRLEFKGFWLFRKLVGAQITLNTCMGIAESQLCPSANSVYS